MYFIQRESRKRTRALRKFLLTFSFTYKIFISIRPKHMICFPYPASFLMTYAGKVTKKRPKSLRKRGRIHLFQMREKK